MKRLVKSVEDDLFYLFASVYSKGLALDRKGMSGEAEFYLLIAQTIRFQSEQHGFKERIEEQVALIKYEDDRMAAERQKGKVAPS